MIQADGGAVLKRKKEWTSLGDDAGFMVVVVVLVGSCGMRWRGCGEIM